MRVCIASSFAEAQNLNTGIVDHLAAAFRKVLGQDEAIQLPFASAADQILRLKPDLTVLVGSALPSVCDYRPLARSARKVNGLLAFWTVEDPYEFDASAKFVDYADFVFTNDLWAANFYDRANVCHLPTAASPEHYRTVKPITDRTLDVFFCGFGYPNRQRFIADALPVLEEYNTVISGENWPASNVKFIKNNRILTKQLADYYSSTKFVLNIGREYSLANARRALVSVTPGPRTFEAAMAGCVQIYYQPSYALDSYFARGEEILTADDVGEFRQKLSVMSADPDAYMSMAVRAQERCLREHSYEARARKILDTVGMAVMGS
jgi:spore maturation protein CgeB